MQKISAPLQTRISNNALLSAPVAPRQLQTAGVSSFGPASRPTTQLTGATAGFTPLPSIGLGNSSWDDGIKADADAIAKEMWLGNYKQTAGGDGEVWRTYDRGSVDGDVLGHVRGVWMGGDPWTPKATFLNKSVVDAVMAHHMGMFEGSQKLGDSTQFTFMNGSVTVDKSGKVTAVGSDAIQTQADAIAAALGLGHFKQTGGGDGELWRTYEKGTVDGDILGRIRGVWVGGDPFTQNATYIGKPAVDAAINANLGVFVSASQNASGSTFHFACGSVSVDSKGNVTGVSTSNA